MSQYKVTIGIEVHAELKTKSKMFCGCVNSPHEGEPNSHVCPVCLAHPGTLPTINEEAVVYILQVGKAIGGTLATYSEFDRKNYFYPDIPKAYQISQYQFPFVSGGTIAGVAITRIHLEEDTARSQHDQTSGSLVDFNRAGVPLMELVTEPVIHDAATAVTFAKELQLLLRSLGVSDANMERGEMRVEANISISDSEMLGTKVEVKNLNSFKAVEQAIEYEVKRQGELLSHGEAVVQETRGWDEQKTRTFSQRAKESANDYRYFPDPDLPKCDLAAGGTKINSRLSEITNKIPDFKRNFYRELGVSNDQIEIIISDMGYDAFMQRLFTEHPAVQNYAKKAANYFTSDVVALIQKTTDQVLSNARVDHFAELITLLEEQKITSRVAKDLLKESLFGDEHPEKIAQNKGLLLQHDANFLAEVVAEVVAENKAVVDEFRAGKEASLQYLVGQGMKKTKGAAQPQELTRLLKEAIAQ